MVQCLSIIFFSWISSIFVGFFKCSRFFCVTRYNLPSLENKFHISLNLFADDTGVIIQAEISKISVQCQNLVHSHMIKWFAAKLVLK